MEIKVHIYLEPLGDPMRSVWWAESPELPGFYAAADHLPELLTRSEAAVREIVTEEYPDAGETSIRYCLMGGPPASEATPTPQFEQENGEVSASAGLAMTTKVA